MKRHSGGKFRKNMAGHPDPHVTPTEMEEEVRPHSKVNKLIFTLQDLSLPVCDGQIRLHGLISPYSGSIEPTEMSFVPPSLPRR